MKKLGIFITSLIIDCLFFVVLLSVSALIISGLMDWGYVSTLNILISLSIVRGVFGIMNEYEKN